MSSTRRGAERKAEDAYMTPEWCVRRLLEAWEPPALGTYVEPAVGEAAILQAFRVAGVIRRWITYDIRPGLDPRWAEGGGLEAVHSTADFLTLPESQDLGVSVAITNPPYKLAEAFVRSCRKRYPNAQIVMLLRTNFLGSKERTAMWSDVGVPDIYQLPNRPDYTGEGGDSIEYAWMVWPPEVRSFGIVRVLGLTSLEIRRGEKQGQLTLGGPDGL